MANCKDCIHYNVCCELMAQLHWKPELCRSFKDRNRFVELPCKVGDTIYEITERKRNGKWSKVIVPRFVGGIEIGSGGFMTVISGTTITVFLSNLGETVFLTREEAERVLKESENK